VPKKDILTTYFPQVSFSIGTNVGDRLQNIVETLKLLREYISISNISSVYKTKALYFTHQEDFYNLAVVGYTELTPAKLMKMCKKIEKKVGRQKRFQYGPREIDIDIVFYGQKMLHTKSLDVPHLLFQERSFVLVPFAEIIPDFVDPRSEKTIAELLAQIGQQSLPVVYKAADMTQYVTIPLNK